MKETQERSLFISHNLQKHDMLQHMVTLQEHIRFQNLEEKEKYI